MEEVHDYYELIENASLVDLCLLYQSEDYDYYKNKTLGEIIDQFDCFNDEHYQIIDNTFKHLSIDNKEIVEGIIEKYKTIHPYRKIHHNATPMNISLNGKFWIEMSFYPKAGFYLYEDEREVMKLPDFMKYGKINNKGTHMIIDNKRIVDISDPSKMIELPRDNPHFVEWNHDGDKIAIGYDRLKTDNVGSETFDYYIMGTPFEGNYVDVHIYDLTHNRFTNILAIPDEKVKNVFWNKSGSHLAISYHNKLRIWDIFSSTVVHVINNIVFGSAVGFNSDDYIAVITRVPKEEDCLVNIYDLETWKLFKTIKILFKLVNITSLCFHPSEPYLLVKNSQHSSQIWNFETTKLVAKLRDDNSRVAVFNEKGDKIISGGGAWNFTLNDDLFEFIQSSTDDNNLKYDIFRALID